MSASLPSLRGLAALSALARHGRQGDASAVLGISRSALAHRIADLESELGTRLVAPQGRLCVLTDDGVALLAAMGDALEKIEAAVAPLQRSLRQLRLSTVNTLAANWLLPRLPDFQRANPDIELAILTTQRVVDFEAEDVDCAIRHGVGPWPGLASRLLFRETLVPAASPSFTGRPPQAWPIVRARVRYRDWPRWWQATGAAGEPPEGGMVVENRAQALEAALAGAGVVLTDRRFLDGHLASGRLVLLGGVVELEQGNHFVRRLRPRNPRHLDRLEQWLLAQADQPQGAG